MGPEIIKECVLFQDLTELVTEEEIQEEVLEEIPSSASDPTSGMTPTATTPTTRKRSPKKTTFNAPTRPSKFSRCRAPTRFEKSVSQLQSIAELTQSDPEDQYDKFGKHVAAQLREMPLRSFFELQDNIQRMITTERLNLLEPTSSSSKSSRPQSQQSSAFDFNSDHETSNEFYSTNETSAELLNGFLGRF